MERIAWRYYAFFLSGLFWSMLVIWIGLYFLLPLNLILFDIFLTRKFDWTLRTYGLPRHLQSFIEWLSVVLLALICSFTIKILLLETYKIPTPSMEETLLAGDTFLSANWPMVPDSPKPHWPSPSITTNSLPAKNPTQRNLRCRING